MQTLSRSYIPVPIDDSGRVRIAFHHGLRKANDMGLKSVVVAVDQRGTLFGSISNGLGENFCDRLLNDDLHLDGLKATLLTQRSKKTFNAKTSLLLAFFTKSIFTAKLMKLDFGYSVYVPLHNHEQQDYLLSYESNELSINA